MKTRNFLFSIMLTLAVLLSACGRAATPTAMMPAMPTADAMNQNTAMPDTTMQPAAWYSTSLTDARTGQAFSVEALKGKVVLLETMAVWCTNCLNQQGQIKSYHQTLGQNTDLVTISLDIDPNENMDQLKKYVETKGFDWLYAISPADVTREIAALYGDQFLNPPSTPMLIIDRQGNAHPLPFGIKSAAALMKAVQPYLDAGM